MIIPKHVNQSWAPMSRFALTRHSIMDAKTNNQGVTQCREFKKVTRCPLPPPLPLRLLDTQAIFAVPPPAKVANHFVVASALLLSIGGGLR